MSSHWCDNIYTTVFTPRDYQVELLGSAFERNTMICLGHKSSKEFIALKLLQELAKEAGARNKVCIYLTCHGPPSIHTMVEYLTDLKTFVSVSEHDYINELPTGYDLFIIQPKSFLKILQKQAITMEKVQLLILEDCHEVDVYMDLLPIFNEFYCCSNSNKLPKVLGLAGPLHNAGCELQQLGAVVSTLEENICCKAETASDIVTVLRYCPKPIEYILQCAPYNGNELTAVLDDIIYSRKLFLNDHRYDPTEIYNTDEFLEELKDIPDPKREPLDFLNTILEVLHEMGPWAAHRIALSLFQRIEKQKIKTPHERHYILLCLVNTALFEIHTICEHTFRNCKNHKELIEKYSSPKVLRLLEVLRLFKPEPLASKNETIKKIKNDLEYIDFKKLSRSLEYSCQSVEHLTKQQLELRSIVENLDPITHDKEILNPALNIQNKLTNQAYMPLKMKAELNQQVNHGRTKRRPGITRRQNRDTAGGSETLCALIFCDYNHTTKLLFELLSNMSRHDVDLKFLKCQFTTDRVADPLTEAKEAEIEHRRQEDVLKRFRMHDCNVLIGTSVLEEGIDLPKCNLVIRWDPPKTYRSYVQCKGRSRAVPAYHIILVAPRFNMEAHTKVHIKEQLSDCSHRFVCQTENSLDSNVLQESELSNEDEDEDGLRNQYTKKGSAKGFVKILNPEVITNNPPTSTEITLKEIKDERPAIKMYKSKYENNTEEVTEVIDTCNHFEFTENTRKKFEKKFELQSENRKYTPYYEVIDLTEAFSKLNEKLKNPLITQSSKKKNVSNTDKSEVHLKTKCYVNELDNKQNTEEVSSGMELMVKTTNDMVHQLAQYREIEKILLQKCANSEPPESEHRYADKFTPYVTAYKPLANMLTGCSVDLSSAVALVNKYCSKLPSDTFTKLTPICRCETTVRNGVQMFQYTLRLPINSPLKYDIVGVPMCTEILARRMAALQACKELHISGELDDSLQPIGKEGFKAIEPDWEIFELEEQDELIVRDNSEPRPGTTKRRQYYYKRIASEFCSCRPTVGTPCYLYFLDLTLQCPIPEEQNTRGRKIYPPEDAQQGFGILTLKKIPKVSSFPIFTRSGEVKVSIRLCRDMVVLTEQQIRCINVFLNYTFTNVLRLQKFLMLFDPDSTENCIFIVPTTKCFNTKNKAEHQVIDWTFLEIIERNANMMPTIVPKEVRRTQEFCASKFRDAVVMPWYRNQDQPQYFYVAEICPQLTPLSCFPGENYRTFKHYYFLKYGITIQNAKQPLLDVDHTSARLNFLTPRYVNRKGVALPTSSEETKRAKRENLEQKQILVPELCTVHPFPASLWRIAVCLPCILYRINGLLLADDIRKKVSHDIGLGQQEIDNDFEWPMLDFGWSLSEVLRKSKECTQKCDIAIGEVVDNKKAEDKSEKEENIKIEKHQLLNRKTSNDIVIKAEKQLEDTSLIEIGTWSNDMADNLQNCKCDIDDGEFMEFFPPNVSFCDGSFDHPLPFSSPTFWDLNKGNSISNDCTTETQFDTTHKMKNYKHQNATFTYYDSDDSYASSYDDGLHNDAYTSEEDNEDNGQLRIAFTSKNEAESVETEQEIQKRNKQLSIIKETTANERNYQKTKNLKAGYNLASLLHGNKKESNSIEDFNLSTELFKRDMKTSGMLVEYDKSIQLQKREIISEEQTVKDITLSNFQKMLPYVKLVDIEEVLKLRSDALTIDDIVQFNLKYMKLHSDEIFTIVGRGDLFDRFNDKANFKILNNCENSPKEIKFNSQNIKADKLQLESPLENEAKLSVNNTDTRDSHFSFDYQPELLGHPGPSPSIILQGLTMSNANDGINLERLETIGDSFLKYAITTYLYITYENVHEGKLSHLRSKQVANLNLYRLGRKKRLGEYMIATKFEPHDNWLPPCYYVPKELEKALIEAKIPPHHWKLVDLPNIKKLTSTEICELVRQKADSMGLISDDPVYTEDISVQDESSDFTCFIPYNLVTQHSIPDKSVADCVEALIGAYLIECGPRGALLFMAWLGIRVLPFLQKPYEPLELRKPGSTNPTADNKITVYGEWAPPKSPLLHYSPNAREELESLLDGFDEFETILGYRFRDRSYLLQAMTHASYSPNRVTDCYQRLEFLGDAVLDYLITRHLYEDPRQHSPGALTDLRSALVNNTIFATLAVRHGFHKYFRHLSPGLNEVIDRFVRIQNENGHSISEDYYLLSEEECDDALDVEVPKALGDVFESIAGAIFLDSNLSLDVVWRVYSNMMKPEIDQFSNSVPKSPIRELLELEPETAKFGKPEKLADGRRVRVTVEVFCKGTFRGIGRNYRIAKCTAAKCALRQLKKQGLITKK